MAVKKIVIGNREVEKNQEPVAGSFVEWKGRLFYKISHVENMAPFFMSIVSSADHWLFISSLGGLTAGRKNAENALFPYTTDDKIHDNQHTTGSKSIFLVSKTEGDFLWEPFTNIPGLHYRITRNLYKSVWGNEIVFVEENHDLELSFAYSWSFSDKFGFVRNAFLTNQSGQPATISLLDGIQNLLPSGLPSIMQRERSNLVDAYKKNELYPETGLGIFSLSSLIIDRAEPGESLYATTVWSYGLDSETVLLSSDQLNDFRFGKKPESEFDIRAKRGAYFLFKELTLAGHQEKNWIMVAEVNQNQASIYKLIEHLQDPSSLAQDLNQDIEHDTKHLQLLVGGADGIQLTNEKNVDARHFANTLFNIMRGGTLTDGYTISKSDFLDFIAIRNKALYQKAVSLFSDFPKKISYRSLLNQALQSTFPDLIRLTYEYLPLTFSRRHGDPSRPWNKFSIEIKNRDGSPKKYYEGNWRDIFQNWEGLALSYPDFVEGMISKFLNASTIDGYNPYRIDRNGINWEVTEPEDPWSFIGYWGDHQIIYLLKLLELSRAYHPEWLPQTLNKPYFVFAEVPYRIRPFEDILKNPYETIDFDQKLDQEIEERVKIKGTDGKLLWSDEERIKSVTLMEKLLITLLTKLSNFVPEGGIWLNTQRPEWNDANNALVGNGLSMVTLNYLYRFLSFFGELLSASSSETFIVTSPTKGFFYKLVSIFQESLPSLHTGFTDESRFGFLVKSGKAGEAYRNQVYAPDLPSEKESISKTDIQDFIQLSIKYLEATIQRNMREDGMVQAYNLLHLNGNGEATVKNLYLMLEGQVAVLSAKQLDFPQTLKLLNALSRSPLFREDQNSYLLYPNKDLPRFLEKNRLNRNILDRSSWLQKLVRENNQDVILSCGERYFAFHPDLFNARELANRLYQIQEQAPVDNFQDELQVILEIYEETFGHLFFTGRSGTFFGYEGLGSIYWHMVSKLVLAVQENIFYFYDQQKNSKDLQELIDHYYNFRSGLGLFKTPAEYGAFPTDPYSHTPENKGAQQPGMTGQVKEDILCRFGELGVRVIQGSLSFAPILLYKESFPEQTTVFSFFTVQGAQQSIVLPEKSIAFTYCQISVIYTLGDKEGVEIRRKEGVTENLSGFSLSRQDSAAVFSRKGEISRITVFLKESSIASRKG